MTNASLADKSFISPVHMVLFTLITVVFWVVIIMCVLSIQLTRSGGGQLPIKLVPHP